jgi:hypothetical protein
VRKGTRMAFAIEFHKQNQILKIEKIIGGKEEVGNKKER